MGFFYAFSVCVMPGLNSTGIDTAIGAMQTIRQTVRNPVYFVTFFLTPVAACMLAVLLHQQSFQRASVLVAIAAVIYLLGVILPTASVNDPMNEALSKIGDADYSA